MSRTLKERVIGRAVSQFGRPRGAAGHVVGWILAGRDSNRGRNAWAVDLLDVQPTDRVLEIGFGPGVAIGHLAKRATTGTVYGVDHSDVMLQQATKRNAPAVREGRVDLRLGSIDALPDFGDPVDKVLTVNCLLFWEDKKGGLETLHAAMRSGGRIAVCHQPRCPGANAETSRQAAVEIIELLQQAGFTETRVETLDLDPPAVCVLGTA